MADTKNRNSQPDRMHLSSGRPRILKKLSWLSAGAAIATLFWVAVAEQRLLMRDDVKALDASLTASAPDELPSSDVVSFLRKVYSEFSEDRIPAIAGGITFFVLLALFPAIASVVSIYGLFGDRAAIAHVVSQLAGFLPGGAVAVLSDELHRLTAQKPAQLGFGFVVSLAIALWSASGGIRALFDGLNVAYEVSETRSFVQITVRALAFTGLCIVFLTATIVLATVLPKIANEPIGAFVWRCATWPAAGAICALFFAVIYRFGPDRKNVEWRWITWGSATAALLWIGGTALFSWYVANYGSYNRTYGALGSAVGFLTWIWLSLVILLSGAELNRELERQDELRL